MQADGVVFTEKLIDDVATAAAVYVPAPANTGWAVIESVLESIFEGHDENGQPLKPHEQPANFDAYPYPVA